LTIDVTQLWKLPNIIKGAATWIPLLNLWRRRYSNTGGTNSARYCYSVWLRHLVSLSLYGFKIAGTTIGELGPGDSIGTGFAALLSGAHRYFGLDVVPFAEECDLQNVFDELVQLYSIKSPIPDDDEFPHVRPKLRSYNFPNQLIEWTEFQSRIERIRTEITGGLKFGELIAYRAPWSSTNIIKPSSLDLIFSQSVLEYVSPLEQTYEAIHAWLKPGGFSSNAIDFSAMYLSPYWNGHWAYSDWEWRVVSGRRQFFLNRDPLSKHLVSATSLGFDVLEVNKQCKDSGLSTNLLAPQFRKMNNEDLRTCGAMIILRKAR
jgi:hypothetical protein